MDTFVDSSWYFVRFTAPHAETPVDKKEAGLLAARRPVHRRHRARDPASALFALLHRAMCDTGHLKLRRTCASRSRRCSRRAWSRTRPTSPSAAAGCCRRRCASRARAETRGGVEIATGEPAVIGSIEKMSKSKKNLVDPDDIRHHYGADCARWFMLSDSPPERDVIYTDVGVDGARRFVQRIWRIVDQGQQAAPKGAPQPVCRLGGRRAAPGRPQGARPVARSIEGLRFNVAVAQVYEFTNVLSSALAKAGWESRRRLRLGPARGRGVPGADDRADDAASGRGMLGAARIQHSAGQSALAPGRSGLAR